MNNEVQSSYDIAKELWELISGEVEPLCGKKIKIIFFPVLKYNIDNIYMYVCVIKILKKKIAVLKIIYILKLMNSLVVCVLRIKGQNAV